MGTFAENVIALMAVINTGILVATFTLTLIVKRATNSMHHEIVSLTRSDAKKNGIIEERERQQDKPSTPTH